MDTNHNASDSQGPTEPPSRGVLRAACRLSQYNVVLLGGTGHPYTVVTTMLREVFGVSAHRAQELATAADQGGRVVCCTTHREHAEFKQEQVGCFGSDGIGGGMAGGGPGSMQAVIELCKDSTDIAPNGA